LRSSDRQFCVLYTVTRYDAPTLRVHGVAHLESLIRQSSNRNMRENVLAAALHQRFLNCPQYARLLARTARSALSELNIAGLSDSAKALVLSVLLHEVKRPFFLVVADNHLAVRFHQELANLSRYPVYFYPNS